MNFERLYHYEGEGQTYLFALSISVKASNHLKGGWGGGERERKDLPDLGVLVLKVY